MRTTIDLDPLVLAALKRRQQSEGKTLGVLVSELLGRALAEDGSAPPPTDFSWPVQSMGARIDINDKDALLAVLDEPMTSDHVGNR
ncbi:MAG: hypothetical protein U0R72_12135 [Nakamurella multipartita]|jgi:hypothetical protein